ncbi:cell division protein FtsQ/DivIB [Corynebacterium sp. H113]|uniref:cell division protein FtsQ/DivIB n=1 Tax=Corynebacterium sp. H113 TaxID=3133419 RepID=UPI00309D8C4C
MSDPTDNDEQLLDPATDDTAADDADDTSSRARSAKRVKRSGTRGGSRVRAIGAAVVALIVIIAAVWAVLWFTPVATVKQINVEGVVNGNAEEIRIASGISEGTPVARVDTVSAARNVASQPWVDAVTVGRKWPSAITVKVTEFTPALMIRASDGAHIIDTNGVEFTTIDFAAPAPVGAVELTGAPQVDAPEPGKVGIDPGVLESVLGVVNAMPQVVREQLARVEAPGAAEVTLQMKDGREFFLGSSDMAKEKGRAVELLLPREEQKWNVSNPHEPTVRL